MIRQLADAGLTVEAMRDLLPCVISPEPTFHPCERLRARLTNELAKLDRRLADISRSRSQVAAYLAGLPGENPRGIGLEGSGRDPGVAGPRLQFRPQAEVTGAMIPSRPGAAGASPFSPSRLCRIREARIEGFADPLHLLRKESLRPKQQFCHLRRAHPRLTCYLCGRMND
ncbi:MerR family DNA-binding protein [Cereibacter sphaeroides]|uniref:MerR family DNA-binding protein n=1 Tax=Cereibacter sphaeroides TaxID=1063 RepID=UPI0003072A3F|nr:MerR family DNA-binding protein [Cereibacter sphaeroides]